MNHKLPSSLRAYIEEEILPRYNAFDKAHRQDHARTVIDQSLLLAEKLDVDLNMVYAIAAYHDTGLCEGREHHHEVSARIIANDKKLRKWFTEEQIAVMADAAEDHRASAGHEPRTIYGRIVAEADRNIEPVTIIRRTVQYGLEHEKAPSSAVGTEEVKAFHYRRMLQHLQEKYGRKGYLKLWFDDSENARQLEKLRNIMDDETLLRKLFDECYAK